VNCKQLINAVGIKDLEGRTVMGIDIEKVENLTRRVDELVTILNGIVEDLRQVSASLKSLAVSQITQPLTTPSAPSSRPLAGVPRTYEISKAIEDIKMMFPEDLESMLTFEEKDDYIIIKPKQFLGSDNFSKIASKVRENGGEYISAGKGSHFRIPKTSA
jgi:hypothetical protein